MDFNFKLNEEESRNAKLLGLPTEYEAKPRQGMDTVEVWYEKEGYDRFSLYKADVVNKKLEKGIWIKI